MGGPSSVASACHGEYSFGLSLSQISMGVVDELVTVMGRVNDVMIWLLLASEISRYDSRTSDDQSMCRIIQC